MGVHLLKRVLSDIRANTFLTVMTIATIALSILVVSSVVLFIENTDRFTASWNRTVIMMAYLSPGMNPKVIPEVEKTISDMEAVRAVNFISREAALTNLKDDLKTRHLSLEGLEGNPLPDAFEVTVTSPAGSWESVQAVAGRIRAIPQVSDVEYGQEWSGWLFRVFGVISNVGYAMAGLFCLTALFITSNTVRLALFSRREEVEVMRLVGATDRFIIMPFYVEGMVLGFTGGILGVGMLLAVYLTVIPGFEQPLLIMTGISVHFVSLKACLAMIFFSGFLGWLGCYFSLKQILS